MSVAVHYLQRDRNSVWCLPAWINIPSGGRRFTFCGCTHPPRFCGATFPQTCANTENRCTHRCLAHREDTENIIVVKVAGRASFINGTLACFWCWLCIVRRRFYKKITLWRDTPSTYQFATRNIWYRHYISTTFSINFISCSSFSKFLHVFPEATWGKERDVFGSDRVYNIPFIHWSAWGGRIHRTIGRGILSRRAGELLFLEPRKSSPPPYTHLSRDLGGWKHFGASRGMTWTRIG